MKIENFSEESQKFWDRYFKFLEIQGWIQENINKFTPEQQKQYRFEWGYFVGVHVLFNSAKEEMERVFDWADTIYAGYEKEIDAFNDELKKKISEYEI